MTDERPRWRDMDRRYLLEGTLVALLILGPSMAVALALDIEQGSIAEWVSAVATLAAVIAAVYAGVQARQLLRTEQRRDVQRDRLARRAQADLVAAWPATPTVAMQKMGDDAFLTLGSLPGVWVRNASPLPVTKAVVYVSVLRGDRDKPVFIGQQTLGTIGPQNDAELEPFSPHIMSGIRAKWPLMPAEGFEWLPELLFEFRFQDLSRRRWKRDIHGTLSRDRNPLDIPVLEDSESTPG